MTIEVEERAALFDRMAAILFGRGAEAPKWLDERAEALAKRYGEVRTTAEFDAIIQGYKRRESKPFELFVVGEGNYGKSTLVNALIGYEISKVHFLPTTRCFLRFVSVEKPSNKARIYVRHSGSKHDWLVNELGHGRKVIELYDIAEYEIDRNKAEAVMAEETRRLDEEEEYEQAIYEIETEVLRNPAGIMSGNLKLVDTQGLNQLFPKEFQSIAEELDEARSEKRFEKWMAGTPRGKHLEWQFRRCDAVLWLLNAKKASSAASRVALKYFSKYGKRIVGTVTHIDRIQGDDNRKKVLEQIDKNYGMYMDVIVPVNAKKALESRLTNDRISSEESGYFEVEKNLESVCIVNGMRTASVGRYNSMRLTERQIRRGLEIQREEINECLNRMKNQKEDMEEYCKEMKQELRSAVGKEGSKRLKTMKNKIAYIELTDTGEMANTKLNVAESGNLLWNVVDTQMDLIVEGAKGRVEQYNQEPYTMPVFDAEGKRARSAVNITVQLKRDVGRRNRAQVRMELTVPGIWEDVENFIKDNPVTEFLFPGVTQRHREKRESQRKEKQSEVKRYLEEQWKNYIEESILQAEREVERLQKQVDDAIDRAEKELELVEGRPLRETRKLIETIAEDMAVKPVVVDMIVGTIRKRMQMRAASQGIEIVQ